MEIDKSKILGLVGIIIVIVLLIIFMFNDSKNATGKIISDTPNSHITITSEEQFISDMISYHKEVVDRAKIMVNKTRNEKVMILSHSIINKQTEDISILEEWRQQWYPNVNYSSTYSAIIPQLIPLSGKEADKAFLEGMIVHHQTALIMSQQVLLIKTKKEVELFAKEIIILQTSEISQLEQLLKEINT